MSRFLPKSLHHPLSRLEIAILADAAIGPLTQSVRTTWSLNHRATAWHNAAIAGLVRSGRLIIDRDPDIGTRALISLTGLQDLQEAQQTEAAVSEAFANG